LGSNLGSYIVSTLHRKDLGLNLGSYIVSTLNRKDLGLNLGRNKRAYLLQKFQTSSSTHPDSNSMQTRVFSLAVSGQGFESHCSRLSSATFKIQWSYISTQPVCLHGTYWDFILTLPPNYVPPPKVHFLSGLVQSFLYITCISHAHHWNYLFNLHWSNYTNIMKSSNNKTHYIIFCVLLLLTPFTYQIFPSPLFSQSPSQTMLLL